MTERVRMAPLEFNRCKSTFGVVDGARCMQLVGVPLGTWKLTLPARIIARQ